MEENVSDDWIVLNVGGKKYGTYRSTLLKYNTLLKTMFDYNQKIPLKKNNKGEVITFFTQIFFFVIFFKNIVFN